MVAATAAVAMTQGPPAQTPARAAWKGRDGLGGPLLRGSLRRNGLQRPAHGLMKDRGRLRNAAFHRLRVLTLS